MSYKRYAVIVGINKYENANLQNLEYCSNDALLIYNSALELMQFEQNDIALYVDSDSSDQSEPSYSNVLSAVKAMCDNANDNDLIMFFFAGHGTSTEEDSYLLTNEYRRNILKDSSISMNKINEYFQNSKAKFKLRLFDACHSGRLGTRDSELPLLNFKNGFNITAEGWATFSACKENQFAYENQELKHGLFSYYFAKGLTGAAANKNKEITLDALKIYVLDNIISFTKKMGVEQTPVFCGEQIGNLILAKITDELLTNEYSSDIEMIRDSKIEDLLPKFENVASDLRGLTEIINQNNEEDLFVAISQDEKIETINEIISLIETELSTLIAINKDIDFEQEKLNLEKIPENASIANKIKSISIAKLLELKFKKATVTKYKEENTTVTTTHENPYIQLSMDRQVTTRQERISVPYEEEFISGLAQLEKYPELAVKIQITQIKKTIPVSAMIVCCLPITFEIFIFTYFISTEMKSNMQESWDSKTINMKEITPIKIHDRDNKTIVKYIDELFSEYISYIRESIQVRLNSIKAYNEINSNK